MKTSSNKESCAELAKKIATAQFVTKNGYKGL